MQVFDDIGRFFSDCIEQLDKESERGVVIVSAALLNETLEQLIKDNLAPSAEKDDELFVGAYAPLDSFSTKIDLAYRLGLVGLSTRSSLHLIRKLRNDFAHSALQISFESNSVQSRIRELFRLNKGLFDILWEVVGKENKRSIKEITKNVTSEHSIDKLVKVAGWRGMFEILVSVVACALKERRKNIEQLKSWADKTKDFK